MKHNPKDYTGAKAAAKLNRGCSFPANVEGYWRKTITKDEDGLPFPVIEDVPDDVNMEKFLTRLNKLESKKATLRHQKGTSRHRHTSERNGSGEYTYKGWTWPEGYSNYIENGVLPSRLFYRFIMEETKFNLGLPNFHVVVEDKVSPKKVKDTKPEKSEKKGGKKEFKVDQVFPVGKMTITDSTIIRGRFNMVENEVKFDLRSWYKTKKMEDFLPSGKGLSFSVAQLKTIHKMMGKAIKMAESQGWE